MMLREPAYNKRHSWNPVSVVDSDSFSTSPSFTPSASTCTDDCHTYTPAYLFQQKESVPRTNMTVEDSSHLRHKRESSVFSSSRYSSPATTISRSLSPDALDDYKVNSIFKFEPKLRPASHYLQSRPNEKQRWSTSSASFIQPTSDQERLLQEKLQHLARSENARLLAFDTYSSSASPSNSRPSSLIDPSPRRRSALRFSLPVQASTFSSHFSSTRPQTSIPDGTKILGADHDSRKTSARASTLAALSGNGDIKTLVRSNSKRQSKKRRRTSALHNSDHYIISEKELRNLGVVPNSENGPYRPGDIRGTVLSWRMSGDILRAWVIAFKSPESFFEVSYFVWSMISNPSNILDVSLHDTSLLPPRDIVLSLKESLSSAFTFSTIRDAYNLIAKFWHAMGRGCFSVLLFFLIFLQVSLLSVFVFAYLLGSVITAPVQYARTWVYKKEKAQ